MLATLALLALTAELHSQTVDGLNPGANGPVRALAVQTDGRILVGGDFGTLGGQPRSYIGRLNPDGTLDIDFNPGASGSVRCLAVQADGKIVVGGLFRTLGGMGRTNIARLNPDGTLDTTFDPGVGGGVYCLAIQPDGKILVGGSFGSLRGQTRNNIGRLNPDGTLDASFNPGTDGEVRSLAIEASGKILAGGVFGRLVNWPSDTSHFLEINADGTPSADCHRYVNNTVSCVAVRADGNVAIAGDFTTVADNGCPAWNLINLWWRGASSVALQADGKIVVGGTLANFIARYWVNAGFAPIADASFSLALNGSVYALAVQADGKILVGGSFSTVNGNSRQNLVRLNNTDPTTQSLTYDGTNITWLRFGTCPMVWRTTFDLSTNGMDWSSLGAGTHIPNGWQPAPITLPTNAIVRARGFVTGGQYNGSTWFVESSIGPAAISLQPISRTIYGGTTANLTVRAVGTAPLSFKWCKDGVSLNDGGHVSGVQTPTLMLTNVASADAGGYSVVVSNALGSATSVVATLSVVDPFIISQPISQSTNGGQTVTFSVAGGGSLPVAYQWYKSGINLEDGANLSGAHTPVLSLTNVLGGDRGAYSVTISNTSGSVTSVVATLSVVDPFIISQPVSQSTNAGQTVTLSVAAAVSFPVAYQWYKGGISLEDAANISGARTPVLTLTNVLGGDAGAYSVTISNTWGSVTSVVATLSVTDPFISSQPVSRTTSPGQTAEFHVSVTGTAPLGFQWYKNGTCLAGATTTSLALTNVQTPDAAPYQVVISNVFGSATSAVVVLTVNLASGDSFNPGADGAVECAVIQADGKVVVGGEFGSLGGQPRSRIGRLNPDGTVDTTFNPGADGIVESLALQPDGKILVGGFFNTLAGQPSSHIGRLNNNGTLDTNFNAAALGELWFHLYPCVLSIAVQEDGKILVGGHFVTLDGQPRYTIGRVNVDGSLDTTFVPGPTPRVLSIALQADGKILVGGEAGTGICRLNTDGTLDTNFNGVPNGDVYSLAIQGDSRILVGGNFTTLAGQTRNYLGRLNTDGSLDGSFNPGAGSSVYSVALQADGRILVGGGFTTLCGQPRFGLGRLNADGSLDLSFDLGANSDVGCLALQVDGKILVGGYFTTLAGQTPRNFCRLNNTEPATQELTCDGSSITWLRGGTSPDLWRTAIDVCTNGTSWASYDVDTRAAGGWRLAGLFLPTNSTVHARGFVTGGSRNCSSWFVDTSIGPPGIQIAYTNWTANAGTTITFNPQAWGLLPLHYQWCKGGISLEDGGNISGVHTSALTLSNLLNADAGEYSLIVSNTSGVTTLVATLNVVDPCISSQPVNQTANPGQIVAFSAEVQGTLPVSYQWRKNGTWLPGATAASLTLTNVQPADAAGYDMLAFNRIGSTTSAVAVLTVSQAICDSLDPSADGLIVALVSQPNGRILVGGLFGTLAGQPRKHIGRLNADGTLDTSFNPGTDNGVYSLAVQTDGKVLVAGMFSTLAGQPRNNLGRLNADGTLDTTFNPGANNTVYPLAVQADGKILAGGLFTTLAGQGRNHIGRLNADGTLDATFNPGADGNVYCLALQPDGSILVGGSFTTLGNQPRSNLGRLNADGTLDTTFNPGANDRVECLALQADGKILADGAFTTLAGQARNNIGRLNIDGSLDAPFNPGADGYVRCVVVQADGKILAGGSFTKLGGQTRNHIGRLNADGSLDTVFDPGADNGVYSLAIQPDGKILAGGSFTTLGREARNSIGRLVNTEPSTQSLTFGGSTVTWLRGATSPEAWRTGFDFSANGTDWINLGAGVRVPGGWQLTGVSLPINSTVRARGFVVGGRLNGSSSFVESMLSVGTPPAPTILLEDGGLGFHADQFGFNIGAIPGQVIFIEASTDFMNWTPVQTNLTTTIGTILFSDPAAVSFPRRFYRVRLW